MMPPFTIQKGEQIYVNDNHHPDRVTGTIWYRHDKVIVDGKPLEGHIQVKYFRLRILGRDMKQNRTEVHTGVGGYCVRGSYPEWLWKSQPQPSENLAAVT